MLINEEYFKGEIVIPNLKSSGNAASRFVANSNVELLNYFIAKYERKFLVELLGVKLCNEFIAGLTGDVSGKWEELKNILVDEQVHESIIANYVYYWFMRNNVTTTTGVGEVETETDNSTRVSPSLKMVSAWNEMVDGVKSVAGWLSSNKDFDYKPVDSSIFHKINEMNL